MLEPARAAGPDVNVGTLRNIEVVLREASIPVSRYFILKQLEQREQGTTQPRLNVALKYLFDHDLAMEGERGIQWAHSGSPNLRRALATGRRV
jgi:hypothetical protein